MGKRIFFGLSGGLGPVMRTLPIAERFRRNGQTVAFSIYDERAAAYLSALGYEVRIDDDPTLPAEEWLLPRTPHFDNLDHYFAQLGLLDERFCRSWIDSRIRMLRAFDANLVYVDMSPHTVIAARYLNIPVVSITQSCFLAGGKPLRYWLETPQNTPRVTPVVNRVLAELHLPPIDRMERLNEGDVTLIPGIPELDPVTSDNVRYVGPIEHRTEGPPHDSDQPYILAYGGRLLDTSGDSGSAFIRLLADAFRNRPEKVVLASGELPDGLLSAGIPDNVLLIDQYTTDWIAHCELVIHHGGHGSCLSAVLAGVPSLIVPTHAEREFNARQMAALGTAECLLPDRHRADDLYALARQVKQGSYRSAATRLRGEIERRNYGGADEAYRLGTSLMAG